MICPDCGKEVNIPEYAFRNAEAYRLNSAPVLHVSSCCNKGFLIKATTKFEVTPYIGNNRLDEWNNVIKIPNEKTKATE